VTVRGRILIATRSVPKLRELRELLGPIDADLVSLDDLGIPDEVEETGATFEANARLKARTYVRLAGLPTIADDSGLEVDALGGGPGVRTKRYAGEHATDADNNAKLLRELQSLPPERRGARYVCVLVLALPDGSPAAVARLGSKAPPLLVESRGTCRGRIATTPRGSGGFGYDPIFEPAGEPVGGRTLGLFTPAEKHAISHRARAARRMANRLVQVGLTSPSTGSRRRMGVATAPAVERGAA
jgi:XTP/dITP diphosphohydrolase